MTTSFPPNEEAQEPNQYNSRCYVKFEIGGITSQRRHFSDLQMAYHWVKEVTDLHVAQGETWVLKSWNTTIQRLYEYHMEDESGYQVADGPNKCMIIYYDI
jgi:hypothetical protein